MKEKRVESSWRDEARNTQTLTYRYQMPDGCQDTFQLEPQHTDISRSLTYRAPSQWFIIVWGKKGFLQFQQPDFNDDDDNQQLLSIDSFLEVGLFFFYYSFPLISVWFSLFGEFESLNRRLRELSMCWAELNWALVGPFNGWNATWPLLWLGGVMRVHVHLFFFFFPFRTKKIK